MKTDLTVEQIEARRRVWMASQASECLTLSRAEVAALWASILNDGREMSSHRVEAERRERVAAALAIEARAAAEAIADASAVWEDVLRAGLGRAAA